MYEKSILTQETILSAARQLFYEKGFKDTHYKDIAESSGCATGLIHYHFKKKRNIAGIIYSQMFSENKALVHQRYHKRCGLQVLTAIEIRNYYHLFLEDSNTRRFIYEVCKNRIPIDFFREEGEHFFQLHNQTYQLGLRDDQIKLINLSSTALDSENFIGFVDGYITLSKEDFIDFQIAMVYELMTIPYKRIREIITLSKEIYEREVFAVSPDLRILLIES